MFTEQWGPSRARTSRHWLGLAVAGLLAAGCGLRAQSANDFGVGSTNLDRLTHFWRAVEASNGPVTVLAFGDSMSMGYRSIAAQLLWPLRARLGLAGLNLTDGTYGTVSTLASGAGGVTADADWWAWHFHLPVGGGICWTNWDARDGTITADQVGLYWISQPGGGTFTFSVSTNLGSGWQLLTVLDGYAPAPEGRATNLTVPRLPYWVRVDGLSGTNVILAPQFLDRTVSGVSVSFMDAGAANLNQILSLATNVTYPVLSALNPQLVIWHMKELGDLGVTSLSNRLFDLDQMWRACVTNGDVLYVGTPYDFYDTIDPLWTPTQNRLVKQAAERDQRGYLDCMSPCHSYSWMTDQGFMEDVSHPNNLGNAYLANLAWQELTWAALRTDRQLAIQLAANDSQVISWPTAPDLSYELQASADSLNWFLLHSAPGDGLRHTFTNTTPASASRTFRLKLTGN